MYYAEIVAGDYNGATNVLLNLSPISNRTAHYGEGDRTSDEEIRTLPLLLHTLFDTLDITRLAIVGDYCKPVIPMDELFGLLTLSDTAGVEELMFNGVILEGEDMRWLINQTVDGDGPFALDTIILHLSFVADNYHIVDDLRDFFDGSSVVRGYVGEHVDRFACWAGEKNNKNVHMAYEYNNQDYAVCKR
ncbi:hypothetical protein KIPB_005830 [Kipferlia bialata]|uniref:Uncharacterized protein n=1 Tax=Kipferlia bialata TaxID=797122 RepID=A0A9K3GJC6_9EUKA|nr:hypothetical protein KIPB_005830 [Kipferlia bialata]|eukprot:g5830.t1